MRNQIDLAWSGHPSEGISEREFYANLLAKFEARMEEEKPRPQDYDTQEEYLLEYATWSQQYEQSKPVIPYYINL